LFLFVTVGYAQPAYQYQAPSANQAPPANQAPAANQANVANQAPIGNQASVATPAQTANEAPAANVGQPATPAPSANAVAPPAITSQPEPVTWPAVPVGWTQTAAGYMGSGTFTVNGADGKQADVSIVPLWGLGGGDDATINRWRKEVNLPALPEDQTLQSAVNAQVGGQPALLFDIAGQDPTSGQPTRILGVIQHGVGVTWFYKMTGDADLVKQQEKTFLAFLQSLNSTSSPGQAPPGSANSSQPTPSAGSTSTRIPADWQPITAGQFFVAKYIINGANGAKAMVSVNSANGDGGGLTATVNRWRGQLGLQPLDRPLMTTLAVPNGQAQLVDLNGTDVQTDQPAELVGIMVTQPGQTWFYKLMGDPGVVAAKKAAFIQFVRGAGY
jgi:hypothetical protein